MAMLTMATPYYGRTYYEQASTCSELDGLIHGLGLGQEISPARSRDEIPAREISTREISAREELRPNGPSVDLGPRDRERDLSMLQGESEISGRGRGAISGRGLVSSRDLVSSTASNGSDLPTDEAPSKSSGVAL